MTANRYCDPAVTRLLADDNKIRRWFEVERAWLSARFSINVEPLESYIGLTSAALGNEQRHGHDVQGFIEAVAARWPDQEWATRWFHYGLTSSDVVDTAESLLVQELGSLIWDRMVAVADRLAAMLPAASGFVWTRTHGRQAEPAYVHDELAIWIARVHDQGRALLAAQLDNREGRFRGPAGSSGRPTTAENLACRKLGLDVATSSFQALNREVRATWHQAVASALVTLDALAMHVKRWVCEESEGYMQLEWSGGVTSSSMVHKRNPTTLERIHGLSTLFASMQVAALHLVPMHDEREIGHSSADRILHDCGANWLAFSCNTLLQVLEDCDVVPGMRTKPPSSFQSVHKLIHQGMSRAQARQEVSKTT